MKRKAGEIWAWGNMLIKPQLRKTPSFVVSQAVCTYQKRTFAGGEETILYVKAKYTKFGGAVRPACFHWKEKTYLLGRRTNVLLGLSPLSRCSKPFWIILQIPHPSVFYSSALWSGFDKCWCAVSIPRSLLCSVIAINAFHPGSSELA